MTIISIGIGLSIVAVTSFRSTLVLNDKAISLTSDIRGFQSDASANKIFPNTAGFTKWQTPFIYQISVSDNKLSENSCLANDDFSFVLPKNCNQVKSIDVSDQDLSIDNSRPKSCEEIDFFGTTGGIKLSKANSQVASCCIYLKNVKSNDIRYIYIDSKTRSIELVNDDPTQYCLQ